MSCANPIRTDWLYASFFDVVVHRGLTRRCSSPSFPPQPSLAAHCSPPLHFFVHLLLPAIFLHRSPSTPPSSLLQPSAPLAAGVNAIDWEDGGQERLATGGDDTKCVLFLDHPRPSAHDKHLRRICIWKPGLDCALSSDGSKSVFPRLGYGLSDVLDTGASSLGYSQVAELTRLRMCRPPRQHLLRSLGAVKREPSVLVRRRFNRSSVLLSSFLVSFRELD